MSPPLILLTIRVASASLSTSSAMMSSGLWVATTFSRIGRREESLQARHGRGECVCITIHTRGSAGDLIA